MYEFISLISRSKGYELPMTLSRISRLTPGQPSSHMIRKNVWDNAGVLVWERFLTGYPPISKADTSFSGATYLWPQKCNFVFLFLNIIIFFHFKLLERSSTIFHNLKNFIGASGLGNWLPGAQVALMSVSEIIHLSSFRFYSLKKAVKIAGK